MARRADVALPPIPGHRELERVPSGTDSYLSPIELTDVEPTGVSTVGEGPSPAARAMYEDSVSAVRTAAVAAPASSIYINNAFDHNATTYTNTPQIATLSRKNELSCTN